MQLKKLSSIYSDILYVIHGQLVGSVHQSLTTCDISYVTHRQPAPFHTSLYNNKLHSVRHSSTTSDIPCVTQRQPVTFRTSLIDYQRHSIRHSSTTSDIPYVTHRQLAIFHTSRTDNRRYFVYHSSTMSITNPTNNGDNSVAPEGINHSCSTIGTRGNTVSIHFCLVMNLSEILDADSI